MKVLYCTDFEGVSEYSLDKIVPFLKKDAEIDIISAIETAALSAFKEYPEVYKADRKNRLLAVKSELEAKGLKVGKVFCPLGNAGDEVLQRIYSDGYSLVIVGSRRRTLLGIRLGSTSRKIVEKSPVPIFVACRSDEPQEETDARKVLFAVDDTENSYNSIRVASEIFDLEGAENEILFVKSDVEALPMEIMADKEWLAKIMIIAQEHADDVIVKTTALVEEKGLEVSSKVILEGFAVDEILKYIRQNPKDLIIMGSHGREGLSSLLLGSVSRGILDSTCSPLVIIPVKRPH